MILDMNVERTDPAAPQRMIGSVDRRRDELLPLVAHELRQPLTAILMALEAVCGDESAVRETLDMARHGARQMSRIIDDVLDVYFNVHGRLRLRLALVDLAEVLNAAMATTRPSFSARNHRISVSLPPEPVVFIADSTRLEQILTNLLTNAAKYSGPGGHIRVSAATGSGVVVIRVGDNGRGISPELLPRIFQPFQQGEDGGLGLGLALVKSLAELHGGGVAVQSDGSGMGSEFVVHLPAGGPGDRAEDAPLPMATVNGKLPASPYHADISGHLRSKRRRRRRDGSHSCPG